MTEAVANRFPARSLEAFFESSKQPQEAFPDTMDS